MATPRLDVAQGDITRETVDAIVNAANSALKAGGGVDGAIHRAAGPALQRELDVIGGCPTGEACLSRGYNLFAPWIIHCVGPVWHGGNRDEDRLLESCYRSALALARAHGLKSLAFPAISTGVYGFPKDRAAAIAVSTVRDELSKGGVELVRFVCFDAETAGTYQRLMKV